MAALTTNSQALTGLRIDDKWVNANAGGDDCEAGGDIHLLVKNAHTGAWTVTLATPETVDGDLAVADRAVSVTNASPGLNIIPVTQRYRDPSTGRCAITYSGVTALQVCVVRTVSP